MSRKFRAWRPEQSWLFPPSPQDWLPEDHLVYFLLDVSEEIDISPIVSAYDSEKGGQPPGLPDSQSPEAIPECFVWKLLGGGKIATRSERIHR